MPKVFILSEIQVTYWHRFQSYLWNLAEVRHLCRLTFVYYNQVVAKVLSVCVALV